MSSFKIPEFRRHCIDLHRIWPGSKSDADSHLEEPRWPESPLSGDKIAPAGSTGGQPRPKSAFLSDSRLKMPISVDSAQSPNPAVSNCSTQHSLPSGRYPLTWAGLSPADHASVAWRPSIRSAASRTSTPTKPHLVQTIRPSLGTVIGPAFRGCGSTRRLSDWRYGFATVTLVLTELAMKQFSWAAWCILSSSRNQIAPPNQ
jgi:hypothetical protein